MSKQLTIQDIQDAAKRISEHIKPTPLQISHYLSRISETEAHLKLENLQRTGSYKFRGALNKLMTLSKEELSKGVVAASAGNHAQGVALAAKILGTHATIIMPEMTPLAKVQGTEDLGAKVVLHGSIYDEAYEHALEYEKNEGLIFIHPFNDPLVIAGQGTIGLEIYQQHPDLDAIFIPVGGGGLISGVSLALKTLNPKIQIIGVEAEKMAAMKASLEAKKIVVIEKNKTIADGIAVAKVGKNTFEYAGRYVDKIVCVNEDELAQSIMTLLEKEKLLAEGAGAAAYSAVLKQKCPEFKNKKVAAIISGGNIDINFLEKIIKRGLVSSGRLCHLSLIVPDTPGTISLVSKIIGDHGANIQDIHHDRTFTSAHLGETDLELTIETKGFQHIEKIVASIQALGIKQKRF